MAIYDEVPDRDGRGRFKSDDDRGQGGWVRACESHAEPARRGWDNRGDDDRSEHGRR